MVRDIATVQNGILVPGVNEGFDYGKLENARKLVENQEYTVNTQLGYISLNQRLLNDEIVAVAFQFTVGDQVFQVGEFANDGVDATNVTNDPSGVQVVNNNNLVLKMLKSAVTAVDQPIWDLMMKNVYNIGAFNPSAGEFAELVKQHYPDAQITFEPDLKRQGIVDSWPEDVYDFRARDDWGFSPAYDLERTMTEYLIPNISKRYA